MIELPSLPSSTEIQQGLGELSDKAKGFFSNAVQGVVYKVVDFGMLSHETPDGPPPKFRTGGSTNLSEMTVDLSTKDVQHDLDAGRD